MRTFVLAMIATILSGTAAPADPVSRPKPDYSTPSEGRLVPAGHAAGNPCAAYGPGFVQVTGTNSCVRVGGAARVDVNGAVPRR